MGGGNIHLDWMGQGEGPWMDGVNQIRNPQSAIEKVLLKNHFHGKLQKVQFSFLA
jgi:hypothetical protein